MDATSLFCPEFSLPVRQFLKSLPDNEVAHIVTREKRALARMQQICAAYDWSLDNRTVGNTFHFLVTKHEQQLSD
ncbi:MAG: TusA-related sulfurtransferase [Oleiphilaceae bacterium]|jgi:TusA-related sulfurtransferase